MAQLRRCLMDERTLLTKYLEPETDDCVEHFKKQEIGNVFYNRATGDDAGFEEFIERDDVEEDA
jgi:hypothetical protein